MNEADQAQLIVTPRTARPLSAADAELFGIAAADRACAHLAVRDGHRPTPLMDLPTLAAGLNIGALMIKDESQRLGLGSFKALGGSYAVIRLALEIAGDRLGRQFGPVDISDRHVRQAVSDLTFACATDGNHGRSVAAGARLLGANSVVFVHTGVSDQRVDAIAALGARIVRVDGSYDASVRVARETSAERGWIVVADTSWQGYETVPTLVMQGYLAMLSEARQQWMAPPTHVFVQAGVGGLAAAMAAHLAILYGEDRPLFVVVEPALAACLFASAKMGRMTSAERRGPTIMAMLECYEPSPIAWRVLSQVADAYLTVEENTAARAMYTLARPHGADPALVSGESGAAGLAGLMSAVADPFMRARLGLGPDSRVLLFNTEGATDARRYVDLVGLSPAAVMSMER